jgi:hypothetical protein
VFQNEVLRRTSEPEIDEVTATEKLFNEDLHKRFYLPNIIGMTKINENEMHEYVKGMCN